jgi:hypothetical protein
MIQYLRNRLSEGSTWAGIGAAVAGGAAFAAPFSWIIIGVGVVACLVPTKRAKGDDA